MSGETNVTVSLGKNGVKVEEFFNSRKFFETGDKNGKKAFYCLGLYARKMIDSLDKDISKKGVGEDTAALEKIRTRIVREMTYNMSYRTFTILTKLLDNASRTSDRSISTKCSGLCNHYIVIADVIDDKKALPSADANLAFSLGMGDQ